MSPASDKRLIAVLNGPNLNLLGSRQPEIYGHETLAHIEEACAKHLETKGFSLRFAQTNSEGALVSAVQEARGAAAILINAAGYTHTSVALLDALLSTDIPKIEVHLSNPAAREAFRHQSVIAPACDGVVAGFGALSYALALDAAIGLINARISDKKGPLSHG